MRCVAEIFGLAESANVRTRERYDAELVSVDLYVDTEGADCYVTLGFRFDPDFSDSLDLYERMQGDCRRIIHQHGGAVDE